uniref:Cytochrome c-553 n=1 Tax=Thaumatella adunca TaxID=2006976 RepID=A0A1Z1MNM9_9FLOR|nr:cytochrome c553 [Thaumatella adunca]ARW67351.1 cytochrome c553 [Thaumatella adunca]
MKLLFSLLCSFFAILLINFQVVFAQNLEIDLDEGKQLFSQNCTPCHAGGNNSVNPTQTLKLDALENNKKDTIDAIIYQVTNGQNSAGMPAFGDNFSEEQIANIAHFVLNQAKNNSW